MWGFCNEHPVAAVLMVFFIVCGVIDVASSLFQFCH